MSRRAATGFFPAVHFRLFLARDVSWTRGPLCRVFVLRWAKRQRLPDLPALVGQTGNTGTHRACPEVNAPYTPFEEFAPHVLLLFQIS